MKKTKKISLATYGERFALLGGTLYFGAEEVYVFETSVIDMKVFFQEMLSEDYRIIGYDLKKDLERIEAYLKGSVSEVKTGQMGLF